MRFESSNYSELFNSAAKKLASRAGISTFNSSSKSGAVLSTFIEDSRSKTNAINEILSSFKLAEATNKDLDSIGEFLGVYRLTPVKAYTKSSDNNFQFYVETGTFGDINDGESFTIPANTIVYLEGKNSDSGLKIEFRTISSVYCASNATTATVGIEALQYGILNNIAANSLDKHNFTSYSLYSQNKLKVRNNYSITNGRSPQSDASYRAMINKSFPTWAKANESAIRLAIQSIAGIKESKIFKNYTGIGTVGIVVDTYEGIINQTLIDATKNKLDQVISLGEIVNVYPPKYVGITFELTIKTTKQLNSTEKVKIANYINSYIKNYFNSVMIGQSIDFDSLLNQITGLSSNITNIGSITNKNTADLINVYYSDVFNNFSQREIITSTLSLDEDQKAILMEIENPILIKFQSV